ncbi:hypothetical protein [Streptomyces sp. NBC_01353]|uniref:hypothetical protein n=1 Tax=Streptomyces sp. NBC_01353 TaxID=2903835 RepID=UPI002E32D573|nr:hypothetical protein [Streptomyces sp. NBC_01353]
MSANPIERLDMTAEQVEQQITEARRSELCAVLRASQIRHASLGNEQEVVADGDAIYLLHHPELCSTDDDYPGFAEQLAARSAKAGGTR